MASAGFSRNSFRFSREVSEWRKRFSRNPRALRSRSKTYLLKQRHGHGGSHRQVVVLVPLARALAERAAHDEPHDHLGALVAAAAHEVLDRHVGEALGVAVDQIEELAVPGL